MTYALVAITHATYGGVYFTDNFTTSGAQPTWTRLTTTGLPSLQPDIFRVDYGDPLNIQYLGFGCYEPSGAAGTGSIYMRNGGNWSLIMDRTIAATITGARIDWLNWLWTNPLQEGEVYTICSQENTLADVDNYILKSTDYGATWSSTGPIARQRMGTYLNVIGDYWWFGAARQILAAARVSGSGDGGVTWDESSIAGGVGWPITAIDPTLPSRIYSQVSATQIKRCVVTTPPALVTTTDMGYTPASPFHADDLYVDENNSGFGVACDDINIYYSEDQFASATLTNLDWSGAQIHAITDFWNENASDLVFGTTTGGAKILHISSKTDTTVANRSGANSAAPPYADSIPDLGNVIEYGIWAGTPPASRGVFVFSVEMEQGDNTWDDSIYSYDALGSPMGGDRSSFRDMYADGFDVYHAEDVHAATPQIHAPWPANSGTAPVSDGTKWVPTDIITQAEFDYSFYVGFHAPVTLDADAALILDLQSATGQEIGLDTQQPTYVWMGPSFAPADEPTFQPMYIEQLANVITTAPIGDGEVLMFDEALGQWVNAESVPSLDDLHEHIINEDHTVDCDGVTVNFSTAYVFRPLSTQVYLNGLRQRLGPSFYLEDVDYNGITFDTAPEGNDMLWMDYIVEYVDYLAVLSDSEDVDLLDSEGAALEDS